MKSTCIVLRKKHSFCNRGQY